MRACLVFPLLTRRATLAALLTSWKTSMAFSPSCPAPSAGAAAGAAKQAIALMEAVYGSFDAPDGFPRPLPADEAGPCANGQRRYLWTDAFAVLNLVSLSESTGDERYQKLAHRLVDCVHDSLGRPRSSAPEDRMATDGEGNAIGLRIGKEYTRKITDYGMTYDGQYWHYTDKWLLALVRLGRVQEAAALAKAIFPYFHDSRGGGGMRWKLSVDSTAPEELRFQGPSDDTLTALITFNLIRHRLPENKKPLLEKEIELLTDTMRGYNARVTSDPLGWGLECLYDQWLEKKRTAQLQRLSPSALDIYHLGLPFRLYGALLGARICPKAAASVNVKDLVDASLRHEMSHIDPPKPEEHSSINRVMLASVLLAPGAFGRRHGEPQIHI